MKTMRRAWKHPSHLDTFSTLHTARDAYPHVTHFKRIWAAASPHLVQRGRERLLARETVERRSTLRERSSLPQLDQRNEDSEDVMATAQAIMARHQQRTLHSTETLWGLAREDVRALSLDRAHETALLRAIYRAVFGALPS
jgi:hypothetical protein